MAFDLHKFSRAIAWSFVEMLSLSQLLYRFLTGDSAGTWTQDPQIKSLVLWPTELRSHLSIWRCKGNMPDRSLFSFQKKSSFFLQKTSVFLKKDKENASFRLVSKCITIMSWWHNDARRPHRWGTPGFVRFDCLLTSNWGWNQTVSWKSMNTILVGCNKKHSVKNWLIICLDKMKLLNLRV